MPVHRVLSTWSPSLVRPAKPLHGVEKASGHMASSNGPGRGTGSAGFLPALVPIRWSDLPGTDWLLRPADADGGPGHVRSDGVQFRNPRKGASTAGSRPRQGVSCAGMLSLIASFCGTFPTAMWGGIDYGFDRQENTPLHPWLAVRSWDLSLLHRPRGERDATGPRKRPLRASEPGGPRITHVVATYQKYTT